MASADTCLLDTNVLLRLTEPRDASHAQVANAIRDLSANGAILCCAVQNIAEYWNVSTRPTSANGLGLTVAETAARLQVVHRTAQVLPEPAGTVVLFEDMLVTHQVRGIQVHDARLAAIMLVNGVSRILTLNSADFARYSGITAINPRTFARP